MNPTVPAPQEESSAVLNAWRVLRERWWIVGLAVLVCVGASLALSLSSPKRYEATSKLLMRKSPLSNAVFGSDLFPSSIDPTRDAATNVLLVKSSDVGSAVRRQLKLPESTDALLGKVTVQSEANADLVDVTARDGNPVRAAQIANAFAQQYAAFRQQSNRQAIAQGETLLRQRLASVPVDQTAQRTQLEQALQKLTALEAIQTGDTELVDRASVPGTPASPRPTRDAILAGVLGLALGVAIAFGLDLVDRRVKTIEDFERLYGLRALAGIPSQSFRELTPNSRSAAFEPYRMLRGSIDFAAGGRDIQTLVVTSAILGEGKTSVAVNLARAAAASGQHVLLVEADLRRPSLARYLSIDASSGLTNAVVGGQPVRDLILYDAFDLPHLGVLPSGPLPPSTAEIVRSQSMGDTLRTLTAEADLVIIDAPPLLPVADAQILIARPEIDAVLVVGRAYFTKREQVRRSRAIIEQQGAQPLGLAVTGLRDYNIYGYYGEADGKKRAPAAAPVGTIQP